ncbi:MAG TPA: DNA repair protein RadC [Polyangiaceae bacterium]|nr:DNA repair protein RadC [Polyangiaceae bacterium]
MVSALPGLRATPDARERALVFGTSALSDADLLAIVLGTGAGGESAFAMAAAVLLECGGLVGLGRLGPHGLAIRRGIGPAKAARVAAALELGRRTTLASLHEERAVVGCFDSVARWAEPRLSCLDHEEVWLLGLDGRNGLKSAQRVAQGGLHGCALVARDVLRPAVRDASSAIVLVHNHPSGDPRPSPEDVAMTREIARASELVGVPLLDHVIVARGGATSLLELGVLECTPDPQS